MHWMKLWILMIILFKATKLPIPTIYQQPVMMMIMMMISSSLINSSSLLLSFVGLLILNLSSHSLIRGIMKGSRVGNRAGSSIGVALTFSFSLDSSVWWISEEIALEKRKEKKRVINPKKLYRRAWRKKYEIIICEIKVQKLSNNEKSTFWISLIIFNFYSHKLCHQ